MFNLLKSYLRSLPKTKKGQAMVEYGLILALVAVVVIAILGTLGTNLNGLFTKVANSVHVTP